MANEQEKSLSGCATRIFLAATLATTTGVSLAWAINHTNHPSEKDTLSVKSADGSIAAFVKKDPSGITTIVVMGRDFKQIKTFSTLTDLSVNHLSISPDGKFLAYAEEYDEESSTVLVIDTATGNNVNVTSTEVHGSNLILGWDQDILKIKSADGALVSQFQIENK